MKILKTKRTVQNVGIVSTTEQKSLEAVYRKDPSSYGSIHNLSKASNLRRNAGEKCTYKVSPVTSSSKKLLATFDLTTIDLAYVDKLAKYNNGVKFLLVAVDALSRKLWVESMRSKTAEETAKTFARMTSMAKPKKVWSDKGTEFRGAFKEFCNRKGIETYTTHSEAKSAFAQRNNRSLKNIFYKHLEIIWSYWYINELQSFVRTINSRVNRMTGMAPNKVAQKHVKRLLSLTAERSSKVVRTPKFKIDDRVTIAKQDLPFKKDTNKASLTSCSV